MLLPVGTPVRVVAAPFARSEREMMSELVGMTGLLVEVKDWMPMPYKVHFDRPLEGGWTWLWFRVREIERNPLG